MRKDAAPSPVDAKRKADNSGGLQDKMAAEEQARDEDDGRSPEKKPAQVRMVIYQADYRIEVESVSRSVKEVNDLVARYEGFVESSVTSDSYRYARIVLRVPVKSFESALADLERLGTVLDKQVSAADVTMEFNDTALRLETATRVRDRLYELLKRTKEVKERVKILREIERLTAIIDSLAAKKQFLKNRADLSTIILQLSAKVQENVHRYIPSPFPWVAGLQPDARSILKDKKTPGYAVPAGFYHMKDLYSDKKSPFLFLTPGEKSGIRIGVVKNYPPADAPFWDESLRLEFQNRMFRIISRKQIDAAGGLSFVQYEMEPYPKYVYIVAFAVKEKYVVVVEARIAADEDYSKVYSQYEAFLKSVRLD